MLLSCLALFVVPAAHALDTGDIVIVSLKGDVQVTMKGAPRAVKAGTVLELPATVLTGRDGAIDLRQGETSVSVGPDTLLEFPALEKVGGPIDRIVQPRGNAFYKVGKRGARKLRVETPYLVGVVKGTQFNVAAQDNKTTISLFEGLLEIRASDESSVIDITAGEIATRGLTDTSIGVLKMDPVRTLPPPRAPQGARSEGGKPPAASAPATPVTRSDAASGESRAGSNNAESNPGQVLVGPAGDATANAGLTVDVQHEAQLQPGMQSGGVDAGTPASPGVTDAVDGIDAAPAVSVAAAPATPAVAIETNVNPGLDPGGAAGNVTGTVDTLDVGGSAAADVGNPNAGQVEVHAGANGGPLAGGESAGVVVDLGNDHGPANVDLGANAQLPGAGVNAGANAPPGNVDLGVNLGNTNVNVDLGLGDDGAEGEKGHGNGNGNAYGNGNGNAYGNGNGNGNAYGNGNGAGNDDSGNPGKGNVVDDAIDTLDDVTKGLLRKPGKK